MKFSADPQLKALGVTILPCRSPQSPCLKVTATSDQIKEAINVVNRHIRTVETRNCMYSKAGEAKILRNNKLMLIMQAKALGCNLKLSEQNITQQFSYDLKGGVTLTLSQGNIAKESSDVLICPLVNMSFNNPVAQQFLQNGGPEIKKDVDALEKAKQSLLAGDVIMTNAGTLKSKKLICAAIPVWGKEYSDLKSTNLADITKENVDVIVNSSNQNLDLNTGSSSLFFSYQYLKTFGNVVLTGGGNLNCKHIAHIPGPVKISNVLKHCESRWITSVSFPAIGTGNAYNGSSWLDASFRLGIATDVPNRSFNRFPIKFHCIQRIQNKDQWQRYAVNKQMLDNQYPLNMNEMDLYHGTTAETCQKVNSNGFNRSFCGKNGTQHGNGTYFAKHSWFSCNYKYSYPDAQGLKYMYQARVLVGKPCLGIPNMVEPAPLDPSNPLCGLHDCAVNNVQKPTVYVVFSDAGAYPDYLISFKES
uniref:Poly [ADP-ribose] polymerase n=1 Tax=Gadus morhua TaxID=8049 RepID=A0A8C5FI42_GADMO